MSETKIDSKLAQQRSLPRRSFFVGDHPVVDVAPVAREPEPRPKTSESKSVPPDRFDKSAYQRDYMRRKRAAKKDTKS